MNEQADEYGLLRGLVLGLLAERVVGVRKGRT